MKFQFSSFNIFSLHLFSEYDRHRGYLSGRFFGKGDEGPLNAEVYASFLKDVLKKQKHIILIHDRASYRRNGPIRKFYGETPGLFAGLQSDRKTAEEYYTS